AAGTRAPSTAIPSHVTPSSYITAISFRTATSRSSDTVISSVLDSMPPLITIAMQLICFVDKEVICTDNESLMQLLSVPSCEPVVSRQDRADASSFVQKR